MEEGRDAFFLFVYVSFPLVPVLSFSIIFPFPLFTIGWETQSCPSAVAAPLITTNLSHPHIDSCVVAHGHSYLL